MNMERSCGRRIELLEVLSLIVSSASLWGRRSFGALIWWIYTAFEAWIYVEDAAIAMALVGVITCAGVPNDSAACPAGVVVLVVDCPGAFPYE